MKKILFPTDFSKAAQNGYQYAVKLAQDLEATIDVMHVYDLSFSAAEGMPAEYIQEMLEGKKTQVEERLKTFATKGNASFKGEIIPAYGVFLPEEITSYAKQYKYDYIIMGTKGERNSFEKLIGSVTTRTMMNAPCPVIAIPENATYSEINTIAYATDFKPTDEMALNQLMNFASGLGAELKFVHIETDPIIGAFNESIIIKNYPFKFTEFTIFNGDSVMEGLDKFIEEKAIDAMALFIPKRRLWERLFHRSFSKRYAFHTKVPLLVFHE